MSLVREPIVENVLDDNRIMLMKTMMLMLIFMLVKCIIAGNVSQLARSLEDNKLLFMLMLMSMLML